MEHAQRVEKMEVTSKVITVLILILMEHAQRERTENAFHSKLSRVLILILMEHAQRVFRF